MVRLETLPGVNVLVLDSDEIEYIEHQCRDKPDTAKEAHRYIEVESEKLFSVYFPVDEGTDFGGEGVSLCLWVDGHWVASKLFPQYATDDEARYTITEGLDTNRGLSRFKFKTLEIHEDIEGDTPETSELGTVKVEVRVVTEIIADQTIRARRRDMARVPTTVTELPERKLKGNALSHGVSFDTPRAVEGAMELPGYRSSVPRMSVPEPSRFVMHSDWEDGRRLGTFTFHYRSLAALKSLDIIERTPSPEPLERRDPETLSAEETRELQRRLIELEEINAKIKKENQEEEDARRPAKRCRIGGAAEVIDLSED